MVKRQKLATSQENLNKDDDIMDKLSTIMKRMTTIELQLTNQRTNTSADITSTFNQILDRLDKIEATIGNKQPNVVDADEKERLRSCVIMGLNESSGTTARIRHNDDSKAVEAILDELDLDCDAVYSYRLGKPEEGKRRLLKVVLPTKNHQRQLIMAAKNLKSSANFNKVFIRPSLTKIQQEEDFLLRKEVRELNLAAGFKKFTIKRGKIFDVTNRF